MQHAKGLIVLPCGDDLLPSCGTAEALAQATEKILPEHKRDRCPPPVYSASSSC